MIIIGVAMLEELKMRRILGETYESYRRRAPFLFPSPRFIEKLFMLPLRLTFRKEYPQRKREIVAVIAFYTLFCLGLSAFYGGTAPLPERTTEVSKQEVEKLARVLKGADNFGEKRRAAGELEKVGEPAMESLIALLSDDHSQVRAYSAAALGGMKSERVVSPLIALLHDSDAYVRRSAAGSLGRTRSQHAIRPLVEALHDRTRDMAAAAARALGDIKRPEVIPPLVTALRDTTLRITGVVAQALGELGAKEAIEPLVRCFELMPNCPYDAVGGALWKLKSDRAVDVWIAGAQKGSSWLARASCIGALGGNKIEKGLQALQEAMKDESKEVRRAAVLALMEFESEKAVVSLRQALMDQDFEVRMYAEEALKRIEGRRMR
jgi:HEAT repeat protein